MAELRQALDVPGLEESSSESTTDEELGMSTVRRRPCPPWRLPAMLAPALLLLGAGGGVAWGLHSPAARAAAPSYHVEDQAFVQFNAAGAGPCGQAPTVEGQALDSLIQGNSGILIVGNPQMRCTDAAMAALRARGTSYVLKELQTPFQYTPGASAVWDWLHCTYPNDAEAGTTMHSYVFSGASFQGQGFAAAQQIQSGGVPAPAA